MGKPFTFVKTILLVIFCALPAEAGSPELRVVQPAGVQRGATATITLRGARLTGALEVHFYEPGLTAAKVTAVDDGAVTAECTVSADCRIGEHHLRLRTTGGLTELRTLWVGAMPIVDEVEPNGDFDAPQRVAMNSTVAGVVTSEDIDYYAVEAKKGDRISAEIEAIRLGRTMFDPAIAILNSERFELAVSDDSSLLLQDSVASVVAPEDGVYVISVREASFGGSDQSTYRLHIGNFPRPTVAYPPGVVAGQTTALTLLGDPAGAIANNLIAPEVAVGGFHPIQVEDAGGISPSPVVCRVAAMPVVTEVIPGLTTDATATPPPAADLAAPADTTTTAPAEAAPPSAPPAAPVAFHGVISKPGEVDRLRFTGRQGAGVVISVFARRLRSPLDAVIGVCDSAGKWLAGNDDAAGADSVLNFTPPADGEYEIRIHDHLRRGGDLFVYRIEIDSPRPALELSLERIDSKRPQHLQAAAIPAGNRFAGLIRVDRQNIGGEAAIQTADLPAGVTIETVPAAADVSLTPVLFTAAADAAPAGALVGLTGTIAGANGAPDVVGAFRQTMPLVIAAPNETIYFQTSVDRLAVAVVESAPFKIELTQPTAAIAQNGTKSLVVAVERIEGFAGEVVLQMLWNPPGIASAVTVSVPGDQREATYPISAAPDAPIRKSKIAILARANVNGGDVWVSSGLVDLAVDQPYLNGSLQMAATERGKSVGMLCKLESRRPFEGTARLTLLGLPPHATCEPKNVSASDTEVIFDVNTTEQAPVGQHGNLFCELVVQEAGESVTHRLAHGGVLRIDAPPVVAVAAPAAAPPPPPAAEAAAPPPRPLSRLEQLRKDAAERAAAKGVSE